MNKEILLDLYAHYHLIFGKTSAYEKAEETFCTDSDKESVLIDALVAETERAFESGFYAAVSLLMGGAK